MLKSKFFRIAVAGATTDGRNIEPEWLEQMAANFNLDKFAPRVFCEHIRGYQPEGPFGAYGDIVGLKAEEAEIDGENRMALFAEISPTPELVVLNKKRQKMYTSMEIGFDDDKDQVFLAGLGITDSPASFGTEMLQFSANAKVNPFSERKQNPNNLFSESVEVELEFTEVPDPADDSPGLLDRVKAIFSKQKRANDKDHSQFSSAIEEIATEVVTQTQQINERIDAIASDDKFATLEQQANDAIEQAKAAQAALDELKQQLADEDSTFHARPPATGGNGQVVTDC
ncbi:GPO family capsid scaffolding protein [Motiliproteus sp.]|uniref:GPO family capsid scaffolding protein n=1 Tax=Motiliproteus sp. TaxID=1898955 RepID=UPI003BAA84A2